MQTTTKLRFPQAGWLGARLRLRQRALHLARRLSPKPAASAGTPNATREQKLEVNRGVDEADLAKLRDKYGIKP